MNSKNTSWVIDGLDEAELLELYSDDYQYALDLFLLFHELILPEMKPALKMKDPTLMQRFLHKHKTSVAHVGLTGLYEKMNRLESEISDRVLNSEESIGQSHKAIEEIIEKSALISKQIETLRTHV